VAADEHRDADVTSASERIRVLLADDQTLVRSGFRLMLEQQPDLEVCGEAADGQEAVRLAAGLLPDVVLMDIRMPVLDGIAATRRVLAAPRPPKVLVLTTFDVDDYVVEALRAGASGYLLKDVEPDDLVRGVRDVAVGDMPLARPVLDRLVDTFVASGATARDPRLVRLSERETEVLTLLGQALSNAEIAQSLFLSVPTVKTHVAAILAKLDLRDRVQAAVFAHRQGLA
jgi:DNA-binding NarL/FixJ family response regulator